MNKTIFVVSCNLLKCVEFIVSICFQSLFYRCVAAAFKLLVKTVQASLGNLAQPHSFLDILLSQILFCTCKYVYICLFICKLLNCVHFLVAALVNRRTQCILLIRWLWQIMPLMFIPCLMLLDKFFTVLPPMFKVRYFTTRYTLLLSIHILQLHGTRACWDRFGFGTSQFNECNCST